MPHTRKSTDATPVPASRDDAAPSGSALPAGGSSDVVGRPLRRDAERNRQRVLDAAARLFAERGADIGYDEIARVAGVGVGTVYRRFPDRVALVDALVATRYARVLARLERLVEEGDPGQVLERFLVAFVEEAIHDAGFRDTTVGWVEGDPLAGFHERIAGLFDHVMGRARRAGAVRGDVVAEDLAMMTTLLSHLRGEENVAMVPRYVALLLEGLRTKPTGSTLPGPVPSPDQTMRLVQQNLG